MSTTVRASSDVFEGVLVPPRAPAPASPHAHKYYQDRNRKWPFHTDDAGARLLGALFDAAREVIAVLDAHIAARAMDEGERESILREGADIYAKKPSIRERDVTWSQAEYRHLGLQREYCRFKSVQRFTETWACLERAMTAGVFEGVVGGTRRVASLGGGPGFELIAVREFFAVHFPDVTLDLISLDLEETWRGAAEGLGLRFAQWDLRSGRVAEACGGEVDFAVASYVFKMYMCDDVVADWLAEELKTINSVLVINRDEYLKQGCAMMESRGVDVLKLLKQDGGRDDRQLVFSRDREFKPWSNASLMTFPNVPYEEHKKKSDRDGGHDGSRGGGGGGGGGGWRSNTRWGGDRSGRGSSGNRW